MLHRDHPHLETINSLVNQDTIVLVSLNYLLDSLNRRRITDFRKQQRPVQCNIILVLRIC
jgi:hypothetical protein